MASKLAQQIKQKMTKAPDRHFEPLTFGELKDGEQFIGLPMPGDNKGHGGFRGAFIGFTKKRCGGPQSKRDSELEIAINRSNAVTDGGICGHFPDSMPVIRIRF